MSEEIKDILVMSIIGMNCSGILKADLFKFCFSWKTTLRWLSMFGRNDFTAILSWDPSTESWQEAGNLAVGRANHAAVAVPSLIIESECSI